jgi:hypothetical protein
LGKYLTAIDADLFAISSAAKEAGSVLRKRETREVDILSTSWGAFVAISGATVWMSSLVGETMTQSKQLRNNGYTLRLVQAPDDKDTEGTGAARIAATRAARRQPRQLRSASLSRVQESVRETKPTVAKMNEYLGGSRKSATARYSTAEVRTRSMGHATVQDEGSTRHAMLVVWQQTVAGECETKDRLVGGH